jgi:predicted enzyme related to lactoylglutathione lyase
MMTTPLLRKVDCIEIAVPDLESGLAFYRDQLGHSLIWRSEKAAGLRLPDTDAEIVLQTERPDMDVDFLVDSADSAAQHFEAVGGSVIVPPFDIQIGRAAVVQDPFGNRFVLLDASKGLLITDDTGQIVGNTHSDGNRKDEI